MPRLGGPSGRATSHENAATPTRLLWIVKNAKNRVGSKAFASTRVFAWATIAARTTSTETSRTTRRTLHLSMARSSRRPGVGVKGRLGGRASHHTEHRFA